MTECQTSGEKLDSLKAELRAKAGEGAANMMHAAITFEVQEVRPFADFGQELGEVYIGPPAGGATMPVVLGAPLPTSLSAPGAIYTLNRVTRQEASEGTRCGRSHEGNTPYAALCRASCPSAVHRVRLRSMRLNIPSTYDASPSCDRPVARGAVSL